jgi:chemotaxis protein histidine kinase CheA
VAAGLIVLWLWRMEILSTGGARAAAIAVAAAVAAAAALGAMHRFPTAILASRLDRASGLADRLGTAVDFAARLGKPPQLHAETVALMRAAVADGVRAAPRANVRAAAAFRWPRDLRALAAFGVVGGLVCLLRFGPEPRPVLRAALPPASSGAPEQADTLDPDDIQYQREIVADMHRVAAETGDKSLEEMAKKLDVLLDKAEKGEVSKLEMLAEMDALERSYQEGAAADADTMMSQLKEQGKELAKKEPTKKLGEALEKGDLDTARKEMEKLADQMEKGALKPEEQKQLADALEKAAEKQKDMSKKQDAKEDQSAQKQIDKQKDEVRRLENKLQNDPKNEELKRTLSKEQRELEKLEREQKQKQQERPERRLDRLTRNMEKAAESLKQKNQEQQRQESSQSMRKAADETRKAQEQMRQQQNQKKMKSKLADLKDAIRRAKPRPGGKGGKAMARGDGRSERIKEWERRAGGQKGDAESWRPGGNAAEKMPWLGKGDQPQSSKQWGDEHDPNVTADPTKLGDAKFKEDQLEGLKGKGPSRRATILTSAKKGFASVSYSKVYADYQKVIEQVMNQEKVPPGYRYYIKRYFQRIRPHTD